MGTSRALEKIVTAAAALCLAACAAPAVHPVSMSQSGDEQLSCPEIRQQLDANRRAADELLHKDRNTERENGAKVVASAVPIVGLFAAASIDFSNQEQIKARALIDRNEKLNYLSRTKGCSEQ